MEDRVMQRDFHYCCIKALAYSAGFSKKDSEIIAYASQFTDDANEHEPYKVTDLPGIDGLRFKDGLFDPICTSHGVLDMITASQKKDSQRKVYIPFHFIPGKPYKGSGEYDYRVTQNSTFARSLVNDAIARLNQHSEQRIRAMIRLGISLHAFADTWSHHNFSGRNSAEDNDIKKVDVPDDDRLNISDLFEFLGPHIPRHVGHGQADHFPDISHMHWRYKKSTDGKWNPRPNTKRFSQAAKAIHAILVRVSPNQENAKDWQDICGQIHQCLSFPKNDLAEKARKWRTTFPGVGFNYSASRWRDAALERVGPQSGKTRGREKYRFKGDKRFFYFHAAAKEHRDYVLRNIRQDLT
jgi:hypothetical protein